MGISWGLANRRGKAIDRLKANIQAISEHQNIEPMREIQRPRRGQDPLVAQMLEAEAFADWTDKLASALGIVVEVAEDESGQVEETTPDEINYESMTVAQLRDLASERELDLTGRTLKADIIAALVESDAEKAAHTAAPVSDGQS